MVCIAHKGRLSGNLGDIFKKLHSKYRQDCDRNLTFHEIFIKNLHRTDILYGMNDCNSNLTFHEILLEIFIVLSPETSYEDAEGEQN